MFLSIGPVVLRLGAAGRLVGGTAGCVLLVVGLVYVLLAHAVFIGVDGDAVVGDAVHDRVGRRAASLLVVPVLEGLLGTEHGAVIVVALSLCLE